MIADTEMFTDLLTEMLPLRYICCRCPKKMNVIWQKIPTNCQFNIQGKIIRAHRIMLARASPYFITMLYCNEYRLDHPIVILDVTPSIFQLIISYAYTDQVDLKDVTTAYEVYNVANRFALSHLAYLCVFYIQLNPEIYNDARRLELSITCDVPSLKSMCLDVIIYHTKIFYIATRYAFLHVCSVKIRYPPCPLVEICVQLASIDYEKTRNIDFWAMLIKNQKKRNKVFLLASLGGRLLVMKKEIMDILMLLHSEFENVTAESALHFYDDFNKLNQSRNALMVIYRYFDNNVPELQKKAMERLEIVRLRSNPIPGL